MLLKISEILGNVVTEIMNRNNSNYIQKRKDKFKDNPGACHAFPYCSDMCTDCDIELFNKYEDEK